MAAGPDRVKGSTLPNPQFTRTVYNAPAPRGTITATMQQDTVAIARKFEDIGVTTQIILRVDELRAILAGVEEVSA